MKIFKNCKRKMYRLVLSVSKYLRSIHRRTPCVIRSISTVPHVQMQKRFSVVKIPPIYKVAYTQTDPKPKLSEYINRVFARIYPAMICAYPIKNFSGLILAEIYKLNPIPTYSQISKSENEYLMLAAFGCLMLILFADIIIEILSDVYLGPLLIGLICLFLI